ncbi:flippase [Clostridium vincentii]|uniref:Colanic acid exporter n=1 Tax=Clostridium vincentii TaxID=52704 RepID=A0A2T0BGE7_9CLOT|nr:flippase [Clostridium vincentii]PRR82913.1 colanic acid exporter [Clostridium vincentii]
MNKLIKNFFSTSVANIIGQLVGFISITYYSGVLEKDNYGMITFAQLFILYFTTVVLFGIQAFGTKLVVKKEKAYQELVNELFSFRLVIAVICCLISFGISFFISDNSKFPLILILWSVTLIPTSINFDWFFSGIQDMKHNAVYNLLKTIVPAIIIFTFVRNINDIYVIPIAMSIGVLCGGIYYILILRRYNITLKFKYNNKLFKSYFFMGLPFLLSGLLSMVNGNIDKIILGFNSNQYGELGVYQAAYNFINFIVAFIGVIFVTLFPYIVRAHSEGRERIKKILQIVCRVVLMITIPISIGGFLLSNDIITAFYDEQYIGAVLPVKILMVYIFVFSIREVYAYSLNAFGLEKKYLKVVGISASLNFLLNLIFIPIYGYIAAAIITTVTEIINLVLMRRYIRKIAKFNDIKEVILVLIPALIMAMFILLIKHYISNVFIVIILAIIIYLVAVLLLRTVNLKELKETLKE